MVQGYDDRLDESLGERRGKESTKKQSYKDRRDESRGAPRKTKANHVGKDTYRGYQTTAPGKMTEKPGAKPSNTGPVKVPGGGIYGKKTAEVGRPKGRIPYYC